MIDSQDVAFILYKNNGGSDKGIIEEGFLIKVRTEDKTDYDFPAIKFSGGNRVYLDPDFKDEFVEILKNNETIKVMMQNERNDDFLFEIISANFAEEYKNIG